MSTAAVPSPLERQLAALGRKRAKARKVMDALDKEAKAMIAEALRSGTLVQHGHAREDGRLAKRRMASLLGVNAQTFYNWLDEMERR